MVGTEEGFVCIREAATVSTGVYVRAGMCACSVSVLLFVSLFVWDLVLVFVCGGVCASVLVKGLA